MGKLEVLPKSPCSFTLEIYTTNYQPISSFLLHDIWNIMPKRRASSICKHTMWTRLVGKIKTETISNILLLIFFLMLLEITRIIPLMVFLNGTWLFASGKILYHQIESEEVYTGLRRCSDWPTMRTSFNLWRSVCITTPDHFSPVGPELSRQLHTLPHVTAKPSGMLTF